MEHQQILSLIHISTKLGYINHVPLVWDNEPARHKLLDIIGDLALIGKPIKLSLIHIYVYKRQPVMP